MQLEYLREFIVFSRYLNFSKAAAYLNIAQPTLSTHIAALEKELGFKLVVRSKQLAITSVGKQFCVDVERILADFDNSVKECQKQARIGSGCIVLESPIPLGGLKTDYDFYIAVARKNFPSLSIEPHSSLNLTLEEVLLQGIADACISINRQMIDMYPGLEDKVEMIELPRSKKFKSYLWVHESNPLAKEKVLRTGNMGNVNYLIPSGASYAVLEDLAKVATSAFGEKATVSHWPGSYDDSILNIKDNECMVATDEDRVNQLYLLKTDRVFVPLEGMEELVQPQIVYLKSNNNPALEMLQEITDKYTEYIQ